MAASSLTFKLNNRLIRIYGGNCAYCRYLFQTMTRARAQDFLSMPKLQGKLTVTFKWAKTKSLTKVL